VLLQVLDDGRLTDGHGRTVDFRNTVVIMTSNLGSQWIRDLAGEENEERMRARVMEALQREFLPEFLNRIDEVVVFHPLSRDHIKAIVELQLRDLQKRLAEQRLSITLTEKAKERLAEEGYDPVYGARPLRRVIQQRIENPLSLRILEGQFSEGQTIVADAGPKGMVLD
jgi:ATP-dependent Clp protease ATP-binding subunit ClpB